MNLLNGQQLQTTPTKEYLNLMKRKSMKQTYIFLILIALSSCQLNSKLEDDTFILLSVLNQQTERYERINSEDFPFLTVIERDSLIVSALINNSDFIHYDRLSTEIYSIDTIPGFKLLDSLEIIDITSKTLTKEELVRLQFKALENAYSKLSFNKFNILNRAKVLVENTKSSYEQSQNDSVKIQLVFMMNTNGSLTIIHLINMTPLNRLMKLKTILLN